MVLPMADNETPEQPAENTPAAAPVDQTVQAEPVQAAAPVAEPAAAPAPAAPRPRLRDHLFTFRSVIAVGVATLLLGGAGGAALVAIADDGHEDGPRIIQRGDRPDWQFQNGPGGGPGFGPPNGTRPDSGSNS